jgi:5-methylcytosine-specific restriction protein A
MITTAGLERRRRDRGTQLRDALPFPSPLLHRESGWQVRIHNGIPEFIPPKWIDRTQTARRKPPHPAMIRR